MHPTTYVPLLLAAVIALVTCNTHLQDWSVQLEEGVTHTIDCNPTNTEREPEVTASSIVQWSKHEMVGDITNGTDFTDNTGVFLVTDQTLTLSPLNAFSAGIYFCKVYNGSTLEGTIVKGINVNGPKKTGMDKYRDNVITGIITGAIVCALVCSGCLMDHFRYRSPEQKLKMQNRKQERLDRQERLQTAGTDNLGMERGEVKTRTPQEDTHL